MAMETPRVRRSGASPSAACSRCWRSGLVLTYKTSGVFNLAFAAQAYASAAVFYVLRKDHEWPLCPRPCWPSSSSGPLIGLLLDRMLFRYLRGRGVAGQAGHLARPARRHPRDRQARSSAPTPRRTRRRCGTVRRTDEWLWPAGQPVRARRRPDRHHRLHRRGGRRPRGPVPAAPTSACGCGPWSRAPAWPSSTASTPTGVDGLVDAVEHPRRPGRRAGRPAVRPAQPDRPLHPAGRRARRHGVRRPDEHPPHVRSGGIGLGVLQAVLAGVLPTDSVLATGLRPPCRSWCCSACCSVPAGAALAPAETTDPLGGGRPAAARPGRRQCRPAVDDRRHPRLRRRRDRSSALACVLVRARRLLARPRGQRRGAWRSIMLSITVITGIGGTISLSPGRVRRHRRLHHRAARRQHRHVGDGARC